MARVTLEKPKFQDRMVQVQMISIEVANLC